MTSIVFNFFKQSNHAERLWLLAKIEYKLRYYENKLGLLWALLKPIMDICIYYVVFKTILKSDIPSFASFLFIGLIIWNFFVESTTGTIQLLQTKRFLYEHSNMNKLEIYISTLLANSIGFFFNLCMFIIFYGLFESTDHSFTINVLWIAPLFVNLFLLALGISLILSNIYIIAKDITQIWTVFISFLFFLSPIFYKLSLFKEALPNFEYGNPIAGIIINARKIFIDGTTPDFSLLMFDLGYAILLFIIGLICLNKFGVKAAEKL